MLSRVRGTSPRSGKRPLGQRASSAAGGDLAPDSEYARGPEWGRAGWALAA